MAIIKSTDKQFNGRKRGVSKGIPFAAVYKSGGRFVLRMGGGIADKAALLHKCELAYDTEKRELIIESNANGNVRISSDGMYKTRFNIITTFDYWNEAFSINADSGRYKATIDDNNNVHVYFNEKIK